MAVEQTINLNVNTGDSVKKINEVKDSFKGVDKGAKQGAVGTGVLTVGVKALGLALKAAGIGIITSLVVGLSSALMSNQKIVDIVNTGMEMFNLTFKRGISFFTQSIQVLQENDEYMAFFHSRVENLGNIFKNSLNFALNNFNMGMKTASILYNASPFGDGSTSLDDLKNLGSEMLDFADTQSTLVKNQFGEFETFMEDQKRGAALGAEFQKERFRSFFKEFVTGEDNIYATASALVQLRNDVKLAEADQRSLQLTFQKDAEIQRQVRDDISKTIDERIEANDKLGKVLEEQAATEKANAQLAVDLAQKEFDQDEKNIDLQVALKNAKTELIDIEERIIGQQSEQKTNENALHQERIDNMAELSAIGKTELEESLNAIDIEEQKRKQLAERTISDEQELQAVLLNIEEDAAKKKKKINDDTKKAEDKAKEDGVKLTMATEKAKRDIVSNTMGSLSILIGENTAAAKALAVGQTLINTYSAAAAALAPPPIGAGPIFGPIAAAGAIASGLANVKSIIATNLPGAEDDPGVTGPDPSVPDSNTQISMGGIGGLIPNIGSITAPDTQPVQAFVVENDISDAQALQQELEIQATL